MHPKRLLWSVWLGIGLGASLGAGGRAAGAALELGPQEIIQAGGDPPVSGYSVPSYVDWNNDGRRDLVVGEGGYVYPRTYSGKVLIYLNTGAADAPAFSGGSYAQKLAGGEVSVSASGCLGAFPRVVDWYDDAKKDLVVGDSYGNVTLFLNLGTDAAPEFDGGAKLTYRLYEGGSSSTIDVGNRATLDLVDWDNDGDRDLVMGALDGKVRLFTNAGSDIAPDFRAGQAIRDAATGSDLVVPSQRSSPVVMELDGDGRKDLLVGNTVGQLLLYANQGTDVEPVFSSAFVTMVEADGAPIDLPGGLRARPFVTDWTGDGRLDVLVGYGDGEVHLFQGVPEPGAILLLASLGPLLLRRKRRSFG